MIEDKANSTEKTDYALFSMTETGVFSFKESPEAGTYKVWIKSTDDGGKFTSKLVTVEVQEDFHGDVLGKVNVTISDVDKLEAYFTELDGLELEFGAAIKGALDHFMNFEQEMMPTMLMNRCLFYLLLLILG